MQPSSFYSKGQTLFSIRKGNPSVMVGWLWRDDKSDNNHDDGDHGDDG